LRRYAATLIQRAWKAKMQMLRLAGAEQAAGLCALNAVDPVIESAWFQPLNL
jgi:hypothetical protein